MYHLLISQWIWRRVWNHCFFFHSFCLCYIDRSCVSLFPVIALTKCPGIARILVFDLLNYPLVMTNIAMV